MADADRYSYATFWSEEDQEWVGLCDAFVAGLSWLDPDRQDAEAGIRAVVEESLEILREHRETPPPPTNPNHLADDPDPSVPSRTTSPNSTSGPDAASTSVVILAVPTPAAPASHTTLNDVCAPPADPAIELADKPASTPTSTHALEASLRVPGGEDTPLCAGRIM